MAVAQDDEGRLVVIKRAAPGPAADRLRREAAALRLADGRGCVELVAATDEPDGGASLATAWVGGGPLASALPLGPARVLVVARSLAEVLAGLHAAGLVHGRVVPEHVLLDDDDRPLLCGLADARLPHDDDGPAPGADVAALLGLVEGLVGDARGEVADGLRSVVATGPLGGAAAVAARLAALAPPPVRPPRRELRPRPGRGSTRRPRRASAPSGRPPVRGLVATGLAAVVLLGLAAAVVLDGGSPASPPHRSTTTGAACPAPPASAVDLDGNGCAEPVSVRAGVVTAGDRRWRVGDAADLAAVADWDCDRRATAAVVRPATGEVWVYDAWASDGEEVTARPGPAAPGAVTARAAPRRSGCARLEVTTAEGGRRLLDLS
jgi:hypothetical protein